jgi:hypothetical protein
MMDDTPLPFDLSAVPRKKLTADFGDGNQSSEGCLLLLRQAECELGVCGRLAEEMPDRRDAKREAAPLMLSSGSHSRGLGCLSALQAAK